MTNFILNWKLAIFALQGLVLIVNILIYCVIKFNDLTHLAKDINKMDKKLNKIYTRLGKVEKKQIARDAICEERHARS